MHTYAPINKSDVSSFNYFSSLEKGGVSFKKDQFLFAESFEWQSFRNVLLAQTSTIDYISKLGTLKQAVIGPAETSYRPVRNLMLDYYSAATLNSFALQEGDSTLIKLINPKTLSFSYILTSAIPSKKVFGIGLSPAVCDLNSVTDSPRLQLRRLL
jgi:hypothetical protein